MEFRRINNRQQFLSILNAETGSGSLKDQKILKYQTEIASIFTDMIRLYTSGDSSSVKDETAVQILGSICYAIDAYTATLENPDGLSGILKEKNIHEIYHEGIKIIHACFAETKKLFENIAENKLTVPLALYNDTIDNSLPEFFRTYNIEFNAQVITSITDYPLVFDDMTKEGIFYINQYLKKLQIETEFCKCLKQRDILKTLYRYQAKYKMDLATAPVNLFEILFDQLAFSVLAGNEKFNLTVTPVQFQQMSKNLSCMDDNRIKEYINNSINKIITAFHIENPGLLAYMHEYQQQFIERVIGANKNSNLINIVLVEGENADAGKNVFTDGERMDDMKFAHLIDLVCECGSIDEKIRLISSNIHSVKDYMDLLEADCLYDDDFKMLYASLGDIELAVLGKSIFHDELHQGKLLLTDSILNRYKKGIDIEWQANYIDFIFSLDEKRKNNIGNLINNIIISNNEW